MREAIFIVRQGAHIFSTTRRGKKRQHRGKFNLMNTRVHLISLFLFVVVFYYKYHQVVFLY